MRKRKGKFVLEMHFLENGCTDLLGYIMRDVIVVDMEYDMVQSTVTYWGFHPSFAELCDGDLIPTYICTVANHKKWIQND